jgi:hypothetical protein
VITRKLATMLEEAPVDRSAHPGRAAFIEQCNAAPAVTFFRERVATSSGGIITIGGSDVRLEERTPISDQEEIGSCVANATMDALELLMPRGLVIQLSRLFAYWISRRSHGDECIDDGTFVRACFEQVRDLGVCREDLYPYDGRPVNRGGRVNLRPSIQAYTSALDHKIDAYYRIRGTPKERVAQLRDAIDGGFPVVGAFALGGEWDDVDGRDVAIGAPTRIVGHHAMVVVGYRELSDGSVWFELRNSWGTGWGRRGYAWVTSGYVGSAIHCTELYVPTLAPIL